MDRVQQWLRQELRWLFAGSLVLSLLMKLLVATSPILGRLNSDQAVLYLTARHVRTGQFTAWFWGQEYGGSLLQTLLGLEFLVTGPHLWMLPVAVGAVSTAVAVLTWRVGVALGHPAQGAVAGSLVAVGPPTWIFFGVASEAFYTVALAASLGSLLLVVGRPALSLRRCSVVGLLAGLALWESPFSLLTTLPTAVLALPHLRRRPVLLLPLVAGTVVGAAPVLVTALRRGSLLPQGFHNDNGVSARIEQAVTGSWAAVFTRFAPRQTPGWLLDRLAVTGLLLAIVIGLVSGVRALRGREPWTTFALLLPAVLWIPFHVATYLPSDAPASRYGLPLLPFLALWVARVLPSQRAAVAAVAVLGAVTFLGLTQETGRVPTHGRVLHNGSYAQLAADLRQHGRTAVYADYWIAYRLTAETDEAITADPPAQSRYAPYALAAATAPQTTFVVFAGGPNDERIAQALAGRPYERVAVAQFAVFYVQGQVPQPGFGGTFDTDVP